MKGLVKSPKELLGQQPIPGFVLEEWERMVLRTYDKTHSVIYEKDMEDVLKHMYPIEYTRQWLFVGDYFEANGWDVKRHVGVGGRMFLIFKPKEDKEDEPKSKKIRTQDEDDL
jgi:hypothetical protein